MRAITTKILSIVLLATLSGCGDMDKMAENMLYPISTVNKTAVPDQPPAGYTQAFLTGSFGKTHLWSFKNQASPNAPVVIYYHGNGENLGTLAKGNFLQALQTLQTHLVIPDFPGFGKSTGAPSMATLTESAETVLAWTKTQFPNSKIVVWGWSTGAAVAARSTWLHQADVNGLVLASAWTSAKAMATSQYPSLAGGISDEFFAKNAWDTLSITPQLKMAALILHGRVDKTVPFFMGEELFKAYNPNLVSFQAFEKGHGDIFSVSELWTKVKAFVHSR